MKMKFFFFALVALIVVSCKNSNPIVQKWTLDSYDVSAMLAKVPKEQQAQMKVMIDEMVKTQKGKFTIEMKEDGKCIVNAPNPMENGKMKSAEGTWKLSADKKQLTTVTDGKSETLNVKELTSDKLTLEIPGQDMSMTFVPAK